MVQILVFTTFIIRPPVVYPLPEKPPISYG
jgi:hypothetical protein